MCKLTVTDVKVIPGEELPLHHLLLVCSMRIDMPPKSKHKFTPHLKSWKLKGPHKQLFPGLQLAKELSASAGVADAATEDICNNIKIRLFKTIELCGTTRPNHWYLETWWLSEHEEKAIAPKGKAFKAWKTGESTRHHKMQPNALPDMQCTMFI